MSEECISEGVDVPNAVEQALKKLSLRRDQVEVTVLQEAASGFFGLRVKAARVLVREKRWEPPTPAESRTGSGARTAKPPSLRPHRTGPEGAPPAAPASLPSSPGTAEIEGAREIVSSTAQKILGFMGFSASPAAVSWEASQSRYRVEVETDQGGLLIGREGRTLEAFQLLVTLIATRKVGQPVAVQIDTQGYWKRHEDRILAQVSRTVQEVERSGVAHSLEPMGAYFRRLVHKALAGHPSIETQSEGDGPWRKVVLVPKKEKEG
ncbi:MAG: Jag N-terminal domain-containing protein [Elusimicrobia bacterium]|nr:Jag N-terminal domain-containing protein [Elusimicrobiota bacterium]